MSHHDHAPEPMPGIPAPLPEGERILWQGKPRWQGLAVRALHARKLAVYFLALLAWRVGSGLAAGDGLSATVAGSTGFMILSLLAVGLAVLVAWLTARVTIYTITTKRVILRFGIAVQMTANIPYGLVQSAALKLHRDGTGDIPLRVKPGSGVSWLIFWPHVRPWSVGNAQPMFRAIGDAEQAADILTKAWAQATDSRVAHGDAGAGQSAQGSGELAPLAN